jgi:broad specificity phosphatase PhoE
MENSVKFYLVRHGQTEMNLEKTFRGRLDPPLNAAGHEEARAAAALLKPVPMSFVISSPLLRAVQTAEPVAKLQDLNLTIMRELIDVDFGKWQGMNEKQVGRRYGRLLSQWKKEPHKVTFPGGESLDNVRERLEDFLAFLKKTCAGRTGAVISHRVPCKVLACMLAEIPLRNFWNIRLDTAGVSLFEISPERTIVRCLNETQHLAALGKQRVTNDF